MVTEAGLPDPEQALNDGAPLLGVRRSRKYAEGHISGEQLLPLSVLPVRLHELPRDRPVHVACQARGRSAQAAVLLTSVGVDARPQAGGPAAWIGSGRHAQTGSPRSGRAPHREKERAAE